MKQSTASEISTAIRDRIIELSQYGFNKLYFPMKTDNLPHLCVNASLNLCMHAFLNLRMPALLSIYPPASLSIYRVEQMWI